MIEPQLLIDLYTGTHRQIKERIAGLTHEESVIAPPGGVGAALLGVRDEAQEQDHPAGSVPDGAVEGAIYPHRKAIHRRADRRRLGPHLCSANSRPLAGLPCSSSLYQIARRNAQCVPVEGIDCLARG